MCNLLLSTIGAAAFLTLAIWGHPQVSYPRQGTITQTASSGVAEASTSLTGSSFAEGGNGVSSIGHFGQQSGVNAATPVLGGIGHTLILSDADGFAGPSSYAESNASISTDSNSFSSGMSSVEMIQTAENKAPQHLHKTPNKFYNQIKQDYMVQSSGSGNSSVSSDATTGSSGGTLSTTGSSSQVHNLISTGSIGAVATSGNALGGFTASSSSIQADTLSNANLVFSDISTISNIEGTGQASAILSN